MSNIVSKFMQIILQSPFMLMIVGVLLRETFNMVWRHKSVHFAWTLPRISPGQQALKITFVFMTVLLLSSAMYFLMSPVWKLVSGFRTTLLCFIGCSDMLYHK